MIFLLPLLIIIAVIFGIDYIYFSENSTQKELKSDENLSQEKQEYIKNLFEKK